MQRKAITKEEMTSYFEANGYDHLEFNETVRTYQIIKHIECGFEYKVTYHAFKDAGTRCPNCYGTTPITEEEMKTYFQANGYEHLIFNQGTKSYQTIKHNECGHEYKVKFNAFKDAGSRCPRCSGLLSITQQQMKLLFEKNGYEHLHFNKGTKSYQTIKHNECGHEYKVRFNDFKDTGSRCPRCSSHRSEKLVSSIFEFHFSLPFNKQRPKFLNGLELDGYNEELKVAFEYNGKQHYKYIQHFHRTKDAFEKQLERDQRKYAICAEKGIKLCIIPYKFSYKNKKELTIFILDWLITNNLINSI